MNPLASLLSWFCDSDSPIRDERDELVVRLGEARHRYTPLTLLASGDVADLHLATTAEDTTSAILYLLKIARDPKGNARLDNERKTLSHLLGAAGSTTYRNYLPTLVDSFSAMGRLSQRVNVFRWQPGLFTLEQVHEEHPALDGRHLAWIFKRLLSILGFCHRQNRVHGAVLPCHVLVQPAGHCLQLAGWSNSVAPGQSIAIPTRYGDWYPIEAHQDRRVGPTGDMFLAARCLVYLAGGDPRTNELPESVPASIRRFLQTCLLESPSMRPDDAWQLLEEFDDLLKGLYGPPTFHELTLT